MNTLTALKPLARWAYDALLVADLSNVIALRAPQRLTWWLLYSRKFEAHPAKSTAARNTVQAFRYNAKAPAKG